MGFVLGPLFCSHPLFKWTLGLISATVRNMFQTGINGSSRPLELKSLKKQRITYIRTQTQRKPVPPEVYGGAPLRCERGASWKTHTAEEIALKCQKEDISNLLFDLLCSPPFWSLKKLWRTDFFSSFWQQQVTFQNKKHNWTEKHFQLNQNEKTPRKMIKMKPGSLRVWRGWFRAVKESVTLVSPGLLEMWPWGLEKSKMDRT